MGGYTNNFKKFATIALITVFIIAFCFVFTFPYQETQHSLQAIHIANTQPNIHDKDTTTTDPIVSNVAAPSTHNPTKETFHRDDTSTVNVLDQMEKMEEKIEETIDEKIREIQENIEQKIEEKMKEIQREDKAKQTIISNPVVSVSEQSDIIKESVKPIRLDVVPKIDSDTEEQVPVSKIQYLDMP